MKVDGVFRDAKAFRRLNDCVLHIKDTFFVQEMNDLLIFIGGGDQRIGVYFVFGLVQCRGDQVVHIVAEGLCHTGDNAVCRGEACQDAGEGHLCVKIDAEKADDALLFPQDRDGSGF